MTTLGLGSVFRVTAEVAGGGISPDQFGRVLLVSTDLSVNDRLRVYNSLDDVAKDYAPASDVFLAARSHFSQVPYPKPLLIGRWYSVLQPTEIIGGAPASVTVIEALSAGTIAFTHKTTVVTTSSFNFDGDTSYSDIATGLAAALNATAEISGATVLYDSFLKVFRVRLADDEALSVFSSGAQANALGLSEETGAVVYPGVEAETIEQAILTLGRQRESFYWVGLDNPSQSTAEGVVEPTIAAVESLRGISGFDVTGAPLLVTDEDKSLAARIFGTDSERAFSIRSATSDYKALSLMALMSSVDFNQPNSVRRAKFSQLPGRQADDVLPPTQNSELDRKNVNRYRHFGGSAIVEEGTLANGTFIDVRYFLDWLVNEIQRELATFYFASPGLVPLTPRGVGLIQGIIEAVCERGFIAGGLAEGLKVSDALANEIRLATGSTDFDGTLPRGYLVVPGSLSTLSQANRDAGIGPPFTVYLKGSGTFNFVDVALIFEN